MIATVSRYDDCNFLAPAIIQYRTLTGLFGYTSDRYDFSRSMVHVISHLIVWSSNCWLGAFTMIVTGAFSVTLIADVRDRQHQTGNGNASCAVSRIERTTTGANNFVGQLSALSVLPRRCEKMSQLMCVCCCLATVRDYNAVVVVVVGVSVLCGLSCDYKFAN